MYYEWTSKYALQCNAVQCVFRCTLVINVYYNGLPKFSFSSEATSQALQKFEPAFISIGDKPESSPSAYLTLAAKDTNCHAQMQSGTVVAHHECSSAAVK